MRWPCVRSRKPVAVLVACGAIAAALAVGAGAPPHGAPNAPQRVYAARFPAGAGAGIANSSCVACHSPTLITQQAKDSTAWEKTIGQMAKWGVTLTPGERDSLRGYLVKHFGKKAAAGK